MEKNALVEKIKLELIDVLNLEGMDPAEIDPAAPLFGDEGLGLDSIDALELIVLLERSYGLKLDQPQSAKEIFTSVNSMAAYILAHQQ